jgi:hypothetical protein
MDVEDGLSYEEMLRNDASEEPTWQTDSDDPTDISVFGPTTLQQIFTLNLNRTNPEVARQLVLLTNLSNKKRYGFRDIIEQLTAKYQCAYAIADKPRNETAQCWLCGFTIKQLGDALVQNNKIAWTNAVNLPNAQNAPECEHLIPVSAALMLFGVLASSSDAKQPGAREYYSANYEWSHHFCNGLKDHALFINIRNADRSIVRAPNINQEYITTFLNKLYKKSPEIQALTKGDPNEWLKFRQASITARLGPLIYLINRTYKINVLLGTEHVISGIADFYDKLIRSIHADPEGKISPDQKLSNKELLRLIQQQQEQLIKQQSEAIAAAGLLSLKRGAKRKTLKGKNNGKFIPSRKRRSKKGRTRRNS